MTFPAPKLSRARRSRALRIGGAALLSACVAGAAVFGFFGQHGPTTVSAQSILRNAQKAGLTAGQTTQFTYQVSVSGGSSSVQIFLQPGPDGRLQSIGLQPGESESGGPLAGMYESNVGHNTPASLAGSTVSGTQTFDGVTCDVVQTPDGATLYFDAQTYILMGGDWTNPKQPNVAWHAVLQAHGPAADTSGLDWVTFP